MYRRDSGVPSIFSPVVLPVACAGNGQYLAALLEILFAHHGKIAPEFETIITLS